MIFLALRITRAGVEAVVKNTFVTHIAKLITWVAVCWRTAFCSFGTNIFDANEELVSRHTFIALTYLLGVGRLIATLLAKHRVYVECVHIWTYNTTCSIKIWSIWSISEADLVLGLVLG